MKRYSVRIKEKFIRIAVVEAESVEDAESKVEEMCNDGTIDCVSMKGCESHGDFSRDVDCVVETDREKTVDDGAPRRDRIVVPMDKIVPNHLEFEVVEEEDGTFTVWDHVGGKLNPDIAYTGFMTREEAERFVLSQPDPDRWTKEVHHEANPGN